MNLEAEIAALREQVQALERGCQERDEAIMILLTTLVEGSMELALAPTIDEKSLAAGGLHQSLVEKILASALTKRYALTVVRQEVAAS